MGADRRTAAPSRTASRAAPGGWLARGTPEAGEPALESRTFTVVGVVRDVGGFRIAAFNKAALYVPTSATMPRTALLAQVHGDPDLAVQALLDRVNRIDPAMRPGI